MSFYTSLSGLQGAQTELSTIAHNLANVSTNGFKRSRVEFGDVIASTATKSPNQLIGSGSYVKSIRQQFSQGGLQQSQSSLDLAISGEGFFVVKPNPNTSEVAFTRNGSFSVSADRLVTDSQGATVQVFPVDGSGTVVATSLEDTVSLRLPQTSGTPKATKQAKVSVNLSANAPIPSQDPQWTAASPYAFSRFDPDTYNFASSTVIYDSVGNPNTLTNYYVRQTQPGGAVTTSDWLVYSFVGGQQISADPTQPDPPVPLTMTFDSNGVLQSPAGPTTFATFTPPNAAPQDMTVDFSIATTQRPSAFTIIAQSQDGAPIGQLQGVTVDANGLVKASFSNGQNEALGKIVLAQFANPQGLRQIGNSYWSVSGLSGDATVGQPGESGFGNLMAGAIERSNVDITEELVGLIAAQRNFQANAKAIDTATQLSQTIINIRS
ncbi:flagellar hook-basal body complex protein [Sphingomonas sp. MAH-20]|uniref:Flagellar hook protein FlgE n=1 Tax=Sphingomonas horti TaxID=2682842 RepID=A0A6I4J7N9_9SPHN|nr:MULTISPECIES: flagellar hook protein FlgE [Sphingomonas]MBA2918848.1 flagellar hook protein FlgE [Sphingomonas sp. CGMCC 1.13658]MVO78881.1 flagellar hook-basal body complex protein [Sphingomonas horti]